MPSCTSRKHHCRGWRPVCFDFPFPHLAPTSQPHITLRVPVSLAHLWASSSLHFFVKTLSALTLSYISHLTAATNHTSPYFSTPLPLPAQLSVAMTSPQLPTKKGSPGNGRNKWVHEQRVCLDILFHHPQTPSPSERERAFNEIFKDHLAACRVPGGRLAAKVLDCQYKESDYTHKSTWAKTWGPVCAVPKQDTVLREQLVRRIDQLLMGGDTTQVSAGPATPPITPPQRSGNTTSSASTSTGKRPAVKPMRFRETQLATPGPSTRKRSATIPDDPFVVDEDEEDVTYEPVPKRARSIHSPTVVLPATYPQTIVTTPNSSASKSSASKSSASKSVVRSPKTKHRNGGRPGATHPFPRPNGSTLMLFEQEWVEAQQDLQVIGEAAAHPETGPSLVFRYWDDKSHGQ